MPAEIVPGEFCASHFAVFKVKSSRGDRTYNVTTNGEFGPSCDCRGYRFRQECRHTKQVWENGCMWNCQWHEGNKDETGRVALWPDYITSHNIIEGSECPNCGGPLVAVRIAV